MAAPVVTSLSPTHGLPGDTISIHGTGFTGATDVSFDVFSSPSFSVVSDILITAEVPTITPAGAFNFVTVTTPEGSSAHTDPESVFLDDSAPDVPPGEDVSCLTLLLAPAGFKADTVTPWVDGICYTVQAIDGWFDSPPVRSGTLEASQFGETVTVNRENARAVDVVLIAHALDRRTALGNVLCFTAIESIKTAFRAVFVPVLMDVVDPSGQERTMLARRVGPIKSQILGQGAAVRFNIPMLGENPVLVVV